MTHNLTAEEFDVIADIVIVEDAGAMYPGYSGRGMYGDRCLGITGDMWQIGRSIDKVERALRDEGFDDAADAIANNSPSIDSLGMSMICYWPYISMDNEVCEHAAEKMWS